ncbi:hypothetical protein N431DRAFT_468776 [Stipitochalara longipes BDJ]|nr:hypothetical protein N431DRAFT_468776 [Stipitochalara longipes BDJ]
MASSISSTDDTSWSELIITDMRPPQASNLTMFDRIKELAEESYPDDDTTTAWNRYIFENECEGIFFTDNEGKRYIWGKEIRYSIMKGHNGGKGWVEMWATRRDGHRPDDRKYARRRYPLTLKQINRPKREEVAAVVKHPSESGWSLPVEHERHFNRFPEEIRRLIFEFALTLPDLYFLQPFVVTCNWVRRWCPSDYIVRTGTQNKDFSDQHRSMVWAPRQDADGPYTEILRVYRKPIDASFLRTSKALWEMGNKILYGGNEFYFRMNNPSCLWSPPSLMARGKVYRPNAYKPEKWEDWKDQVDKIITQIENQVPLRGLTGWAYYDPFLRFLYTIGPENARLLKSLRFEGNIKLHLCAVDCTARSRICDDDLVWSLHLYIPFILKFCPAVEKLTLFVEEDVRSVTNMQLYPVDHPLTYQAALLPLLCNEIREIGALKEIAILTGDDMDLDFVEPAVHWFKERTQKWAYNAVEQMRAKLAAEEAAKNKVKLTCGFCGEEHVWVECYNLCNFCGRFGHFRRTCPMRQL